MIPSSVAAEIKAGPENDPARSWLGREGVEFIRPDLVLAPTMAAWDLGGGEQAVLNWVFHHPDYEAILDDRAARKCARILGIEYRGTLGVVLAAKQRGLIPEARPVFDELIRAGLLVERALVQGALRLVGVPHGGPGEGGFRRTHSRAASTNSRSRMRSAKRKVGRPLWDWPSNSPGPRNRRSASAT